MVKVTKVAKLGTGEGIATATKAAIFECLLCGYLFVIVCRHNQKYSKRTPCNHMCGRRVSNDTLHNSRR
jgi:predicted RNA-binding Zn-ribbon protein involved in translation (DUF1610 family)